MYLFKFFIVFVLIFGSLGQDEDFLATAADSSSTTEGVTDAVTRTGGVTEAHTTISGQEVTTGGPGPTEAPGSTAEPYTGPSTTGPPTPSPGPTTTRGAIPVVTTVEHVPQTTADPYMSFNLVCEKDTCKYHLDGPQVNQTVNDIVNNGTLELAQASPETYGLNANLSMINNNITEFFHGLDQSIADFTRQFGDIENNINKINSSLDDSYATMQQINSTMYNMPKGIRNCYYQTCVVPSLLPTTTTTTTTAKPTTSNACGPIDCNAQFGDTTYPGVCQYTGGIARCLCDGNLDPNAYCKKAGCLSTITNSYVQNGEASHPFWSENYNSTLKDADMSNVDSYPSGIDCQWRFDFSQITGKFINIQPTNKNSQPAFYGATFTFTTPTQFRTFSSSIDYTWRYFHSRPDSPRPFLVRLAWTSSFADPNKGPCLLLKYFWSILNKESPKWVNIGLTTNNVPAKGAYFDWEIVPVTGQPTQPNSDCSNV